MTGDIENIEMLLQKQKQIKKRKFIQRIKESKTLLAIVMLAIGISWTMVYYEGRGLYQELFAVKRIVISNVALAAEMPKEEVEINKLQQPEKENSQISTIKRIAKEKNIDWKLVYAVCLKESGCKIPDCSKVQGACDGYRSMGYFQINKDAHPDITEAQANDLAWSATWTINHGMKYKDNPALFFKNHNGIAKTTNQWYMDGAMAIYKNL